MKLLVVTQAVDKQDPVLGFFHEWLLEFAKHTEHLTVFALRVGEYDLPDHVTVVPLRVGAKSRPKTILRFLYELYSRRASYDQVFVHMNTEYVLLGGPLWKLLGKRVVLWYTHKHVGLRLRLAELFVDRILTASKESLRLPSRKVLVMGHGIAMPEHTATHMKSETLHIVTVGRIAPAKRIRELVQALGVLYTRNIPFTCSIIGVPATEADVEYAHEIEKELAQEPYRNQVQFVGAVRHEHLPEHLAKADVFVNLSLTGSLDKAVLEALVSKVAVVTSNEAFESLLRPEGLYIDTVEPEVVADAIVYARGVSMELLSEHVRKTHSLSALIPAILRVL
jgi:glycosyltransferase involved in cell wall biosynthesis